MFQENTKIFHENLNIRYNFIENLIFQIYSRMRDTSFLQLSFRSLSPTFWIIYYFWVTSNILYLAFLISV